MIYHLSIPAHNTWQVSSALADFMGPKSTIHRFPMDPRGYFVIGGGESIAAIEVYPSDMLLKPGKDLEGNFTPVQAIYENPRKYQTMHFALQSPLNKQDILDIAARNGWQALYCRRGEDFHVVEVWLENELLVEVIAAEDKQDTVNAHNPSLWGENLRK